MHKTDYPAADIKTNAGTGTKIRTKFRHAARSTRHLVISALFIALGIVLPMLFHLAGVGNVFLPIHIPVLIAAFVLPFRWSLAVAVLVPVISSLATGMPPIFPVLPLMLFELPAYAFFVSLFSRKLKLNNYVSLVSAQILGRGVLALAALMLQAVSGKFVMSAYFLNTVLPGIAGVFLQIVVVPPIVFAVKRAMGYNVQSAKR